MPFVRSLFASSEYSERAKKASLYQDSAVILLTRSQFEGRLHVKASLPATVAREGKLLQAAPLTEYAWKFRYPGDPEQPTSDEAQSALAIARAVSQEILERLPADVRP